MKSFIVEDEIEKSMKKLTMYKNSLSVTFDDIKTELVNLGYAYKTDNTGALEEISFALAEKEKVVNLIQNDNVIVLEKNLENYRKTAQEVADDFKNII